MSNTAAPAGGGAPATEEPDDNAPQTSKRLRFVVLGSTGAGKSTFLNRITTPFSSKRAKTFPEGDGADAGTIMPAEKEASWFGDAGKPLYVVDMPGLDDSLGPDTDTQHIQNTAQFLMQRPDGEAHMFVLIVNGASPRFSHSIRNMMTTFKKVFDAEDRYDFYNYLAVVFTKVNFLEVMYPDGDEEEELRSQEDFARVADAGMHKLGGSWAARLAEVLGHKGNEQVIKSIASRIAYTDSRMPYKRAKKLEDAFGYSVENTLNTLYLSAVYRSQAPFRLAAVRVDVKAVEAELQEQLKEAQEKGEAEKADLIKLQKEQLRMAEELRLAEQKAHSAQLAAKDAQLAAARRPTGPCSIL